jgi:hypothetical protein
LKAIDPRGPIFDRGAAEDVTKQYFQAIKSKDFDRALSFYAPKFFAKTPREQWLQTLQGINTNLGDLQSYQLLDWLVRVNLTLPEPETIYVLRYRVTYSKSTTEEIISLSKPLISGETRIFGHQIEQKPTSSITTFAFLLCLMTRVQSHAL